MIRGSLYGYFTRNGAQRGRLGHALDAYDGQQTSNTPQWTRRHLISAPQ
jgi:hypothetical protein